MADGLTTPSARRATPADSATVARLLHDFNTEFDAPSPGVEVLAERLRSLLAGETTFALLADEPPVGVALVTLHTNVWYPGPVALLDELYVEPARRGQGLGTAMISLLFEVCRDLAVSAIEIGVDAPDVDAQRFYERHGFHGVDPDTGDRAFHYWIEL